MSELNLLQKLHKIQEHVDALSKDEKSGKGNFGYKYVSGNLVLSKIRPLMNKYGLLLKQEIVSVENTIIDYDTRNGSKREILTKADQLFTWIDVDSGEREEVRFSANGKNEFEKGLGSALTYAERYFLMKFFHIPTDEDDVDTRSTDSYKPQNNNKKWLNEKDFNGNPTREWNNVLSAIQTGKINSSAEVRREYKVSKELSLKIEQLIKNR